MHTYIGTNINTIYRHIAHDLVHYGLDVKARGLRTKELLDVHFELTNPRARFVTLPSRAMDMRYCMGELCFFLDAQNDLSFISHYSKFWLKLSDDGQTANSAYGKRLFKDINKSATTQFENLIVALVDDPSTRKAVMPIYTPDDSRSSKDNPCTMFLQFIVRYNRLHCYTFMRSNDIWLGTPYDVAFFTVVHEIVYETLKLFPAFAKLTLGNYYHHATSMHIYEPHYDELEAIMTDEPGPKLMAPNIEYELDVKPWFSHLLAYERLTRLQGSQAILKSSPFQTWCQNYL